MTVDVGFPVNPRDAARVEPEINAGETPSGGAIKDVHHASHMSLRGTCGAMETHIRQEGLKTWDIAWRSVSPMPVPRRKQTF